jgi:hypothetical protein
MAHRHTSSQVETSRLLAAILTDRNQLLCACRVVYLDPAISTWLKQHDPKAYEQLGHAINHAR